MTARSALSLLFLAVGCLHAADVSSVRVRVEQDGKSDTTAYKTVQSRSLTISVSNISREALDVNVKYVIFGRDINSKDVVTVAKGESKLSVKGLATEKFVTPVAHAVSEEARTGSKGKHDAAGNRFIGQGVQVWKGNVIVAESYEPESLKESFGKAPAAKLIEKKK